MKEKTITLTSAVRKTTWDAVKIHISLCEGIGIHIAGLPDASVKECLLRVATALQSKGFSMPGCKAVIEIEGAENAKFTSSLDLPIALGLLAASGKADLPGLERWMIVGELNLAFEVQPVPDCTGLAGYAHGLGLSALAIPQENTGRHPFSPLPVHGFKDVKTFGNACRSLEKRLAGTIHNFDRERDELLESIRTEIMHHVVRKGGSCRLDGFKLPVLMDEVSYDIATYDTEAVCVTDANELVFRVHTADGEKTVSDSDVPFPLDVLGTIAGLLSETE